MAEEEKIMEHAKKAVQAISNKENSWKKKIKEFLFEILIIIVAVSLTLWFHNLNDQRNDSKMEKNFLIGIRDDLKADTSTILGYGIRGFQPTIDYYDSVFFQIMNNRIDTNYVNNNQNFFLNTAYFIYNDALFQSFKSSGYLRLIENKKLLTDITFIYDISLPIMRSNDKQFFDKRRDDYDTYIGTKLKFIKSKDDSDNYYQPVSRLLNEPAVQYQFAKYIILFNDLKGIKLRDVKDITKVIVEINKELNDRF